MDGFLLARPGEVVRGRGVRKGFVEGDAAAAALRAGSVQQVVGALPFDPDRPAALFAPERFALSADSWLPTIPAQFPQVEVVEELPTPMRHRDRVSALIDILGKPGQTLRKVVAARSVVVRSKSSLDPELVAAKLHKHHPTANIFAVDLTPAGRTGVTLLGASPEVLVEKRGTVLTMHPVAGTMARRSDRTQDQEAAEQLLASAKNRAEHAFVIEEIREKLAPLCRELSIPSEPRLMATNQVWHLGTPIRGELSDPEQSALDIALLLHPTPAVCGTPTAEALQVIRDTEPDRGFYGGAAGWCDRQGDGVWVISIRSAELAADQRTLRAFAGGGIVADSRPQDELDETTAKLQTFLTALRPEAHDRVLTP